MLVDTSGLFCCMDESDKHHSTAVAVFEAAFARLSHSYVLAEFVPLCEARGLNRLGALTFMADLLDHRDVEIVWVDESLHRAALEFLEQRLDKTYSLCDAVSLLLMRDRGIHEALTTDRHFEQEGFVRLRKP